MIRIHPREQLGHAKYSWLETRYHFSFAYYYNPERMGFGKLRVINEDRIDAQTGFETHPHRDMEIISYVRSGAITHRDSEGNVGRTEAGDVQVMSAGTGILHSEHNEEDQETTMFQIWIKPREDNVTPRWDHRQFPHEPVDDHLHLLVSGDGEAPLFIHQDAKIFGGRMTQGSELRHPIEHQAYVIVSDGEVQLDGQIMKTGDGAEIVNQNDVTIEALGDAEIIVIDVPE